MIELNGVRTWGVVLSLIFLGACLDGTSSPHVGSESHFLSTCDDTCPADLTCICGVCSMPCDSAAECDGLPTLSACFPVSTALGCEDSLGLSGYCDVECELDSDCWDIGEAHYCDAGVCRADPGSDLDSGGSLREVTSANRQVSSSPTTEHEVDRPGDTPYPVCPTAIALGRTLGSGDEWGNRLDINLGATLELDASASKAVAGVVVAYEWELVRAPLGSVAKLTPTFDTVSTTVPLDLPGEYLVALRVFDDAGRESCEPDLVVAYAKGLPRGIHVQAVSGSSPAPELHLLHPAGDWDDETWDCSWRNGNPDWGEVDSSADDPWLTREATASTVVESIFLGEPGGTDSSPLTYQFGVYQPVRSSQGSGGVLVRVFIDDDLVFEDVERALDDQFWLVGSVTWPARSVDVIDEVVDRFP